MVDIASDISTLEMLSYSTALITSAYWAYEFDKGWKEAQDAVLNREYDSVWEIGFRADTGYGEPEDNSFIENLLDAPRQMGKRRGLKIAASALAGRPEEKVYDTSIEDIEDSLDESDIFTLHHRMAEGYEL